MEKKRHDNLVEDARHLFLFQMPADELSGLVKEAAGLVTLCRKKIHAAQAQVEKITERLERDAPFAEEGDAENDDDE